MSDIENAEIPWSEAVVMVCTKCSRKIAGDESIADSMKSTLKSYFKENGLGRSVRTVTASCFDICPKSRVAIVVAKRHTSTQALTVDPDIKSSDLIENVRKIALPQR